MCQWLGLPDGPKVEVEELPHFFRHHTDAESGYVDKETAQRFQDLQTFLQQSLRDVKVYRVGERRITALIVGKTDSGEIAGLKIYLIET